MTRTSLCVALVIVAVAVAAINYEIKSNVITDFQELQLSIMSTTNQFADRLGANHNYWPDSPPSIISLYLQDKTSYQILIEMDSYPEWEKWSTVRRIIVGKHRRESDAGTIFDVPTQERVAEIKKNWIMEMKESYIYVASDNQRKLNGEIPLVWVNQQVWHLTGILPKWMPNQHTDKSLHEQVHSLIRREFNDELYISQYASGNFTLKQIETGPNFHRVERFLPFPNEIRDLIETECQNINLNPEIHAELQYAWKHVLITNREWELILFQTPITTTKELNFDLLYFRIYPESSGISQFFGSVIPYVEWVRLSGTYTVNIEIYSPYECFDVDQRAPAADLNRTQMDLVISGVADDEE